MILSYLLSLLLGAASFCSSTFMARFEKRKSKFSSFAVGLAIVYVFLQLLPEAYQGISIYGITIFVSTLIGFSIFHVSEKLILKYEKKPKLRRDFGLLHLCVFFFYHATVGIALAELVETKFVAGILFAISLSFIYLTTSALFEDLHAQKGSHILSKRIFSAGTFLLGVILADVLSIDKILLYPAFGFISGVLIYIVGKEVLPQYKASNPWYFTAGIILYTTIILLLNFYGLI